MTAEDVVDRLDLDDFDEPMMPGSGDKFSDCDLEDEDENDNGRYELNTLPNSTSKLYCTTTPS